MPRKKDEETVENGAEATEETAVAAAAEENSEAGETREAGDAEAARTENTEATEEEPKKSNKAASEGETQGTSIVDAVVGTIASAVETVASTVTNFVTGADDNKTETGGHGKRSERIGMVTSDKMTKTVVVRVDRLVKHPKYRKYVRRRKQFMAHDELGATIGDKVRIIETRPLSARKRWRVVEIVQKAAK